MLQGVLLHVLQCVSVRVAVYCTCVAGHAAGRDAGRAAEQCVLQGVVQVVL